jgi:hypothetical protein
MSVSGNTEYRTGNAVLRVYAIFLHPSKNAERILIQTATTSPFSKLSQYVITYYFPVDSLLNTAYYKNGGDYPL